MVNLPTSQPPATGLTSGATFPDLAAEAVRLVAPQELRLLPEVTAAWLEGEISRSRRRGRLGGSVGFGVGPELLSSVIYPILTGAFAQVLGAQALEWRSRRRRWGQRRRPRPEVPPIRADQAEAVRVACLDAARKAGLSARRAALLADAVCGRLLQGLVWQDSDR